MIRLVQRRLIVPRGDTGTFSIPILAGKDSGDAAIFTVFDPLMHRKIFEKEMSLSDGALGVDFTHNDTVNLPVGQYVWDIKFYTDPLIVDGKLVGGTEVDSYYSAFTLPICEIRETGDNLLMSDDAPTGALRPGQVDIITASIREITSLKESAAESAANADTSATNAESSASAAATSAQDALDSKVAALAAQQTTSAASESAASAAANAQASATLAAQRADQVMVELGTKANIEDLAAVAFSGLYSDLSGVPTRVSQFINDAGYLTQHQDISGKANIADLATVATSGSYNDLEDKPTIPQRVSDLQDDSGHYTKPASGIPASDLAAGVLDIWSGLTYHTSTMSTDSDSFVLGGATDAPTEINKCLVTSTPEANVIPKFDYQGRLHSVTPEDEWDGSNAVATTEYVDNMISDNMPEVPTNVSELNNDAGYITGYTETDPTVPAWAKAAQKPTYTAAEVGAPTVQEMNDAIAAVNTMKLHICTQGEYNSETGVPTIQNPDTQTFYLVPGGDSNNLFIEWAYVNNAWERFGSADVDLSNYATLQDIPEVPVEDIQLNGNSILNNRIANIPIANSETYGIVKIDRRGGINTSSTNGYIYLVAANDTEIKSSETNARIISPLNQHKSVFYGLAKAAGDTTQSVSTNAVGTYTDEAKEAIQQMLDVPSTSDIPSVPVQDVQVGGISVLANGVANIISAGGALQTYNGKLCLAHATEAFIKNGESVASVITPNLQHYSVFYGLAKAAGDTTQKVSTNAVGTYTDEAKEAIQNMLDVPSKNDIPEVPVQDVQIDGTSILNAQGVAIIPFGGVDSVGVAGIKANCGLDITNNGLIKVSYASEGQIKPGTNIYRPIVPAYQHMAAFWGLAKAAGDTTQSVSTNAVGTYTDEAKEAIQTMLGVTDALASKLDAAEAGLKVVRLI